MQWFNDVDLNLRIKASAGAIAQLFVTLLVLFSWWLFEKIVMAFAKSSLVNGRRVYADRAWRILTHCITLLIIFAIIFSLMGLILWSFAGYWSFPHAFPDTLVSTHWQNVLSQIPETLSNTLIVGVVSTSLALVLTLFALEAEQQQQKPLSTATSLLIYLPLLIPSIAFLFGIVWMKEQIGGGSVFLYVIMGHLLFVLPYVFLSMATSFRKLDQRYAAVAASLGCSPWRIFWQVKLPQLSIPMLFTYALGLAISFSQYLPTLLLGGGRINTLTTEAVALSSGSSRRLTAVYVIMQLALPALGFLLAWLIPKIIFRQRQ
jgi:putative thiamine transport system permease protein